MVPSGPPNPVGGAQSVPASLLRSNSTILGGAQAGSLPSQQPFSSLISPRTQFTNTSISNSNNGMGLLNNMSNMSSLLNHSFGNGGPVSGGALSVPSINLQRSGVSGTGDMLGSAESDPLSFAPSNGTNQGLHFQNPSGNQLVPGHSQPEQLECMQNFQRQFSLPHNQQQTLLRGGLGNVGSMAPIKLEPQMGPSDKSGLPLHGIGTVKLETQQMQSVRSLGPVKLELQHSDSSLFLQQQQQQQQQQQMQMLQMPRPQSQSSVAHISLLQQQRILQLQQQQQQQIMKNLPQQRNQLQQQLQQVPVRHQAKPTLYEPGMCARRLTHYIYQQQHRPEDNNIEFWRKFVAEFFASNAKKRWCVSLYGSGRQTTGVFPQDAWHCEICSRKPGRGFETTVEVLPRLLQIKYASGTLEELLYIDMPREYQNASGQIVLDYAKAIQESVFEQLRVVREGQFRIVFSPDLKIYSWEFCARRHEEIIPRRLLIPQVSQLGTVVQKYQNAAQNTSLALSTQDLQSTCNSFVASARQLAKALEVPLVNDLGYTKRYVRCLQISEVVNCMKDLIDYSRETGTGPMDSLINFPRRNIASAGELSQQGQPTEGQQPINQNPNHNDQSSAHVAGLQLSSTGNGMLHNNSVNTLASSCTTSIGGLYQNTVNRQENQMSNVNGPYGDGNTVQIPSASSSNSLPPSQPNGSSPFPSPTLSASNHNSTHLDSVHSPANMSTLQRPSIQSHDADPTERQSSVQQILQEMIISSQLNGVNNLTNDLKEINCIRPSLNGGMVGNGISGNAGSGGMDFSPMGMMGPSTGAGGLRAAMANNTMAMNAGLGMNPMSRNLIAMNHQQQHDIGNRLLADLSQVNFSNLQFDWKPSP